MDTKEKIQEIIKAIDSGVPKNRIDGKQGEVNKLFKDTFVSEFSVNKMYENLLDYHKNPKITMHR